MDCRIKVSLGIGLTLILLFCSCRRGIRSDWDKVIATDWGYDAVQLVEPADFEEAKLTSLFQRFVASECKSRKVARLSVATTEFNLRAIGYSDVSERFLPAGNQKLVMPPETAARVFCFQGSAEAQIRANGQTQTLLLAGAESPRNLSVGVRSTVITNVELWSRATGGLNDTLSVSVRASQVPTVETARTLFEHLKWLTGVDTDLVIRTDSFFFTPTRLTFDVFEPDRNPLTKSDYRATPYVWCSTSGDFCQAESGIASVTRPLE
jgi:hypothetical protein